MQSFSSSIKQPSPNASEGIGTWNAYMKKRTICFYGAELWATEACSLGKGLFFKTSSKLST